MAKAIRLFGTVFLLELITLCSLANITDSSKNKTTKQPFHSVAYASGQAGGASEKEPPIVYPPLLKSDAANALRYMEKFATNRRAYIMRMYGKSKKYFPRVQAILKKYDVPAEFAVLLALESAFNANAVSKAGAVGYWQIMDNVAKEYGLKIVEDQHKKQADKKEKKSMAATPKKHKTKQPADDRKNFVKSTHTAAKYLKARMKNLDNNWLLIAASYNWGVGNVWNAMAASGKKNPDYWDIAHRLPAETKAYVMNFITLNVVFKNYEQFKKGALNFKANKEATADLPNAEKNNSVVAL